MNIATRIQHHRSRARLLPDLIARLDGLDPVVVPDPGGQRVSSWRSHRACLEAVPADATHLLCLQDDTWPCDGFADAARAVIAERPDEPLALFVPGFSHLARQVAKARLRRERWLDLQPTVFVPLVAIVYPAEIARQIPAFADSRRMPVSRADDAVVSQFMRANQLRVAAVLPSLVEHRDDLESVMLRGSRLQKGDHRRAAWYEQTPRVATSAP